MSLAIPFVEDEEAGYGSGRWLQVRASTASAEIVSQIRQRLFEGQLKPGDFLGTEGSLSARFGVSRITFRDALRILEANGIVEVKVGKAGGVRVCQPNPERFADALAVQLVLSGTSEVEIFEAQMGAELRAIELASERATPADFDALDAQVARCAAALDDQDAFVRESLQFHLLLVQTSQNRALVAQFQALRHLAWRALAASTTPERARRVLERHRAVMAALRAGEVRKAKDMIRLHFRHVIEAHSPSRGSPHQPEVV